MTEAQDRARAIWGAGDFDAIAARIRDVGRGLVKKLEISSGDQVLDVACGTGNVSLPAAATGADVTGLDISPKLLEDAKRNAASEGVEIEFVEGDAQDLPFEDDSFDVVASTFGCMFAPDHAKTASEIVRVLKPGGRFGVAAWKPEGNLGKFFLTIAKYAPPPPEGFQPPPLWGLRDHVTEIFAPTGAELSFEDAAAHWRFESYEETVEEYSEKFGPIVVLRDQLKADGRWEDLKADLYALYEETNAATDGGVEFDGQYLITQGKKPG